MIDKSIIKVFFLVTYILINLNVFAQSQYCTIEGNLVNEKGEAVSFANVAIENTQVGTQTDANGRFSFKTDLTGERVLVFRFLGYKAKKETIKLAKGETVSLDVRLEVDNINIEEVVVSGKSKIQQISEQALNVSVIDAKAMHNSNMDVSSALDRTSGIKVRTSGGVGSNMNVTLNGFSGKQIRFFIDGIPVDNFGSSMQLNNIPIDMAERIEVYKGVVPVGLGADALGGAINIVTNQKHKSSLSASYSYGSFNTHKSFIEGTYVAKSGFRASMNVYQNYSDNNYKMKVDVADINTGAYTRDVIVRRFNDTYHNEMITADIGIVNKSFIDELLFGINIGQNYKEIQTGARSSSVFGKMHRHGDIVMPRLKFIANDITNSGLDIRLNANFNFGTETYVDTVHRRYNWYEQYKEYNGPGGERSYNHYEYNNNNGIVTSAFDYTFGEYHRVSLGNTFTTFNRKGVDFVNPDATDEHPRKSQKDITGLSYNFNNTSFDISALLKHYFQKNDYMQRYNPSGRHGDYAFREHQKKFNDIGYGLAASYFINDNLQVKASFEKSYRLPENEELFGDMIYMEGNSELEPEKSHNYNLGVSKWIHFVNSGSLSFDLTLFYRDTYDFIRPRLNNNQIMLIMENLGNTRNKGIEFETRFTNKKRLNAGFNFTYQDLRNYTQYEGDSDVESVVYKDRIPNMPYLFGNADLSYAFTKIFKDTDRLNLSYSFLYVHVFYLYWPSLGSNKLDIPTQVSHNISASYNLNKQLQFTLECTNLLDAELYDNFSLQKPGRSISGKIRYQIF